jgi:hypothetical protein
LPCRPALIQFFDYPQPLESANMPLTALLITQRVTTMRSRLTYQPFRAGILPQAVATVGSPAR